MSYDDPRLGVHNVSVTQLPPTRPNPRKKFGHTVKYRPSSLIGAADNFVPFVKRAPLRIVRRHR